MSNPEQKRGDALKPHLWLIKLVGVIVPRRLRSDWRQEREAEVALPLVLLVGAGLLLKSFRQLMPVDAGFDARNVLTLRLRLPDAKYRAAAQTTGFL